MDRTMVETEEIRIGNWRSRLPSDVCTNRKIFDEIFSLDTWNNVLKADQREKLMDMLPKELSNTPEEAKQIIEDLFSGALTAFSRNPLTHFFEQLEKGQYDPFVIDTKLNIMREWKKESLRQLKSYHTRLLEDIVVSRHRHLTRLRTRLAANSKVNASTKKGSSKAKKQPGVGVLQNASSELNSKLSAGKPLSQQVIPEQKGGAAKEKDKIVTISSKKRKAKEEPADAESGIPVSKKAANSKLNVQAGKRNDKDKSSSNNQLEIKHSQPQLQQSSKKGDGTSASLFGATLASSAQLSNVVTSTSKPLTRVRSQVSSRTETPTSAKASISDSILTSALTGEKSGSIFSQIVKPSLDSTNTSTNYTSHTKSSPILASQLQASPQLQTQVSVKVEDSLGLYHHEPESACRITLNYQKLEDKSSDDDLETSSDEFEAIQPTIGFGTAVPASTIAGILSSPTSTFSNVGMTFSPGNTLQSTSIANSTTPVGFSKLVQVQHQGKTFVAVSASSVVSSGNTHPSVSNPVYILSTKNLTEAQQQRFVQIPKDSIRFPISSHQQNISLVSSQNILKKSGELLDEIKRSSEKVSTQAQLGLGGIIQTTNPCVTSTQQPNLLRLSTADLSGAKNSGLHCITTSTGQNLILHSLPHNVSKSSTILQSNMPLQSSPNLNSLAISNTSTYLSTSSPGAQQFLINQHQTKLSPGSQVHNISAVLNTSSTSSSSLLDSDELNLSLGSLGSLGIGLGMNLSNISTGSLDGMMDHIVGSDTSLNMKLEMDVIDKIDDLSVLDGNPFDSIPNLSDELDGLDLDLVDGLCDFDGLLSDEKKYPSFFSLIRDVLCSTRDHRMNLMCLEKTIRKWTTSSAATLNSWFLRISDWNNALVTALNFLAGNYQGLISETSNVHPEDFVPYIEYKYKTKYYQWIGAGRDGDNNLTPLCSIWMENMDRLPSVKKLDGEAEDQEEDDEENEDSELVGEDAKKKNKRPVTPPPPRCVTDWSVRPSSDDEKSMFRKQERSRFENPHKAFTYTMHGYESVVGPVKGVYSSQVGLTNKARGHSLLVDDRPPYVTILALVRDAVARLPNGEGTRSEICEMLRDSAFLAPDASSVTLNSVVSGALDRLHYERDPCVRYDSHKKSWIYLHRDRTQEQFERLHHNRSYTKSTKSRNNTTRKARSRGGTKGTPQTPTTPGVLAASDASPTTTSSTIVVSPSSGSDEKVILCVTSTASTVNSTVVSGNVTGTGPSGHPSRVVGQNITLATELKNISKVANSSDVLSAQVETDHKISSVTTSSMSLPTIRLSSVSSDEFNSQAQFIATTSDTARSLVPTQFVVQSSPVSNPVSSGTPQGAIQQIQLQARRPLQMQAVPSTTSSGTSVENSNLGGLTTLPNQPGGLQQGQVLFGPSTVLRLANALRLSHLRLPGNTIGNVRLPQHRILLTGGSMRGQSPTQGILLGQTATGQTVILSTNPPGTMGGFPTFNQIPNANAAQFQDNSTSASMAISSVDSEASSSVSNTQTSTYQLNPLQTKPQIQSMSDLLLKQGVSSASIPISISNVSTSGNVVVSKAGTVNVGGNIFDLNSTKVLQLNICGTGGSSTLDKTAFVTASPSPNTINIPTQEFISVTSGSNITGVHQPRQPVGYTISTVRGSTSMSSSATVTKSITGPRIQLQAMEQNVSGLALNQQQTTVSNTATTSPQDNIEVITSAQGQTPMTSPIIIRSVQGDLMLPGHIALGKGVQGIKLIPFPMGNKTMLAKIIPPIPQAMTSVGITSTTTTNTSSLTQPKPTSPTP